MKQKQLLDIGRPELEKGIDYKDMGLKWNTEIVMPHST